uniref:Uncharacterized protein n=1 Tax=Rhizophora mucronata TaxID=61149 RepID=A0A2P2MMJ7_RHIMU
MGICVVITEIGVANCF